MYMRMKRRASGKERAVRRRVEVGLLCIVPVVLLFGAVPGRANESGAESSGRIEAVAPTSAPMPTPPRNVSGALATCPTTAPTGERPPGAGFLDGGYGNDALWTNLWMMGEGPVVFEPGGPGFVLPDGSLGIKWAWYRHVRGHLSVEGRRLDAAAPPAWADISAYGDQGFQPIYLIFPTAGCWEITGRVGTESLTFVTHVVKIGDGPNWRPTSMP